MKNLILALIFILPLTITAQQNNVPEIDLYMNKANKQRKTGNILLISGGGLIVTGLIVGTSGDGKGFIDANALAGSGIFLLGGLSALTSIPFYISANNNRKKSLKFTPVIGILETKSGLIPQNYAMAGIKINF